MATSNLPWRQSLVGDGGPRTVRWFPVPLQVLKQELPHGEEEGQTNVPSASAGLALERKTCAQDIKTEIFKATLFKIAFLNSKPMLPKTNILKLMFCEPMSWLSWSYILELCKTNCLCKWILPFIPLYSCENACSYQGESCSRTAKAAFTMLFGSEALPLVDISRNSNKVSEIWSLHLVPL